MMKYSNLISSLKRGEILPVYLFYGEEEFLLRDALGHIIKKVVDPRTRDFNFNTIYCREASVSDILAIALTVPIMSERRLLVLRDIDALKVADVEGLLPYLKSPSPSTCLVMISDQKKYNNETVTTAVKDGGGAVVAFYALQEREVRDWIAEWARSRGLTIAAEAVQFVAQIVGNDLQKINNELEKVEIYINNRKEITLNDVKLVVGDFREFTPYDLADAIGRKDRQKAFLVLSQLLQEGVKPVGLLGMIAWNFRRLLRAKSMESSGMSYDEIKKRLNILWLHTASFMEQMNKFSEDELRDAIRALLSADQALKSGGQDQRLVLDRLILTLLSP